MPASFAPRTENPEGRERVPLAPRCYNRSMDGWLIRGATLLRVVLVLTLLVGFLWPLAAVFYTQVLVCPHCGAGLPVPDAPSWHELVPFFCPLPYTGAPPVNDPFGCY